jgi:riboflavin synthase
MFTGIVEERGTVAGAAPLLRVTCRKVAGDARVGYSVAVNGVCLTVIERGEEVDGDRILAFDVSDETARRSTLGELQPGDPVNLERPVTLLTRLGGHLVQGHVDGVGRVARTRGSGIGTEMTFEVPAGLMPYIVEKGSVAVDGVSLTVAHVAPSGFEAALIPHTLEATTFGVRDTGDPVNIEVDVVAKYVEGLLRPGEAVGG